MTACLSADYTWHSFAVNSNTGMNHFHLSSKLAHAYGSGNAPSATVGALWLCRPMFLTHLLQLTLMQLCKILTCTLLKNGLVCGHFGHSLEPYWHSVMGILDSSHVLKGIQEFTRSSTQYGQVQWSEHGSVIVCKPSLSSRAGGFICCFQDNQYTLHLNAFACFFWQAGGLCRPVKAGNGSCFQGIETALCYLSFSAWKTISQSCAAKDIETTRPTTPNHRNAMLKITELNGPISLWSIYCYTSVRDTYECDQHSACLLQNNPVYVSEGPPTLYLSACLRIRCN